MKAAGMSEPGISEDDEPEPMEPDLEDPGPLSGPQELIVTEAVSGQRLDRVLTAHFSPGLSRARLQALIRHGHVTCDGVSERDPGAKTKLGQRVITTIPEPLPAEPAGEAIPLAIVYEDPHLLVLDKPAGLVVHPAAGHAGGTLVNALIAHCGDELSGIGGVRRPGIVHRLDKETSGLLVVAKTDAAHRGLSEQFAAHGADGRLARTYEAFVWGVPLRSSGVIDANLARSTANRTRMAVVRDTLGRHAVTHYETAETFTGPNGTPVASRLRLVLETGRTHQIRVHLAHLGHPVMGDPTYGTGFKASIKTLSPQAAAALTALGRQALHAVELGFEHPATGRPLHFTSSRPADIETLYQALKGPETLALQATRGGRKRKISKP
jgi:23S rRNA pseudouridine1911/1915/1917 synthase